MRSTKLTIPALKLGQAVQIDWADSKSLFGWTYNPNAKRSPGYIRSLGYVVQLNEECITVTTSMDDRGASLDDFSIPTGAIKSIKVLPADWNYIPKEAA